MLFLLGKTIFAVLLETKKELCEYASFFAILGNLLWATRRLHLNTGVLVILTTLVGPLARETTVKDN